MSGRPFGVLAATSTHAAQSLAGKHHPLLWCEMVSHGEGSRQICLVGHALIPLSTLLASRSVVQSLSAVERLLPTFNLGSQSHLFSILVVMAEFLRRVDLSHQLLVTSLSDAMTLGHVGLRNLVACHLWVAFLAHVN